MAGPWPAPLLLSPLPSLPFLSFLSILSLVSARAVLSVLSVRSPLLFSMPDTLFRWRHGHGRRRRRARAPGAPARGRPVAGPEAGLRPAPGLPVAVPGPARGRPVAGPRILSPLPSLPFLSPLSPLCRLCPRCPLCPFCPLSSSFSPCLTLSFGGGMAMAADDDAPARRVRRPVAGPGPARGRP